MNAHYITGHRHGTADGKAALTGHRLEAGRLLPTFRQHRREYLAGYAAGLLAVADSQADEAE